jgi:hypothetical protein
LVAQVKARNILDNSDGVLLVPVAGNKNEKLDFVQETKDKSSLSPDEKVAHQRELALAKLQRGMFWLKDQKMPIVDNDRLVGLLIELRSSRYGRDFDEFEENEGFFDIQTGLCNYALCEAVARQKDAIEEEVAQMRAGDRQVSRGSFVTNKTRRGRVGAA